jgi:uncharacterized membrane protein
MDNKKLIIPTNRLEAFADAVFAIAMTLLVLNIGVPVVSQASADRLLGKKLIELLPSFYNFALSFLLLGIFWVIHHKQYLAIKKSTEGLAWINIFLLMFVVLVPFSTELMEEYSGVTLAAIIFHVNLFILGFINYYQYKYAINHKLIDEKVPVSRRKVALKKNMVMMPVATLAIIVAFFSPSNSTLLYLAIPFITRYMNKKYN